MAIAPPATAPAARAAGSAVGPDPPLYPVERSPYLLVEGAGHTPYLEQPDRFNRDLARFVESLDR